MTLVRPGEEGELLIGGVGLAYGYLYAPELTAEVGQCFVAFYCLDSMGSWNLGLDFYYFTLTTVCVFVQKFISNPFSNVQSYDEIEQGTAPVFSPRVYRTGDVVKQLPVSSLLKWTGRSIFPGFYNFVFMQPILGGGLRVCASYR